MGGLFSKLTYDPETADIPTFMVRLAAFGWATLLGVLVTLAVSNVDLRKTPPVTAIMCASCAFLLQPEMFDPVHPYIQTMEMWRAILAVIWIVLAPWALMQKIILWVQSRRQPSSESADAAKEQPIKDKKAKKNQ